MSDYTYSASGGLDSLGGFNRVFTGNRTYVGGLTFSSTLTRILTLYRTLRGINIPIGECLGDKIKEILYYGVKNPVVRI